MHSEWLSSGCINQHIECNAQLESTQCLEWAPNGAWSAKWIGCSRAARIAWLPMCICTVISFFNQVAPSTGCAVVFARNLACASPFSPAISQRETVLLEKLLSLGELECIHTHERRSWSKDLCPATELKPSNVLFLCFLLYNIHTQDLFVQHISAL